MRSARARRPRDDDETTTRDDDEAREPRAREGGRRLLVLEDRLARANMASAVVDEIAVDASEGRPGEYDLAGFGKDWVDALVERAFGSALRAKPGFYPSCKFVIGGGKKTRSKYDDDLLKHLTAALRAAEYEDDRGASACELCQGSYKYQHDTDKDLKYLHVFPRVVHEEEGGGEGEGGGAASAQSPEYRACTCDLEEFEQLVEMYTPSFSQKRALLRRMKVMEHALGALEQKVIAMESLNEREQTMYDSMIEVAAKIEFLQNALDDMIKKGRLTKGEQSEIVEDLQLKLEDIGLMVNEANEEGKPKRVEMLAAKKELAQKKIDSVLAKPPIVYTVPHERELADLKKELNSLKKIASQQKGKLMSGADAARVAKIPALEERIANLENSEDKGWYEDECKALLFPEKKPPPAKATTKTASSAKSNSGWLTKASKGSRPRGAQSSKPKASNPFDMLGDE